MVYDYIFCGFGLSTFLVLDELENQDLLQGKRILILEKEDDFTNKTWCFWENNTGKWDALLSGKWQKGYFTDGNQRTEILGGLAYKSISAARLQKYTLDKIRKYSDIALQTDEVLDWADEGEIVAIHSKKQTYSTRYFFNSAYSKDPDLKKTKVLLQHFEGWFIKAKGLPFPVTEATLMDFSVPQKGNTRFMYVLPFSENTMLVEYTLFSPGLIEQSEYQEEIASYLQKHNITDFEIVNKESGVIPMTAYPFWKKNSRNVLHIGTAGGWTKASTGYTFSNAVKKAKKLADLLRRGDIDFTKFHTTNRFYWYDRLFISVLYDENNLGKTVFRSLFTKSKTNEVLRFLNEESSLLQELRIISACPKRPFLMALLRLLFKKEKGEKFPPSLT